MNDSKSTVVTTTGGKAERSYEDNLYISDSYGYKVEDFELHWFDWGGFSMQVCLLLNFIP